MNMALAGSAEHAQLPPKRPIDISNALLRAGFRLSARLRFEELSEQRLVAAAGVELADFHRTFGDLDAFIHVLQQRLAQELGDSLRAALWTEGDRRARLMLAAQSYLDLCRVRHGAQAWVQALSQRSPSLSATRRKHDRQLARQMESELCGGGPAAAQAEARLLVASLLEAARMEAESAAVSPAARHAVSAFIEVCTAESRWPRGSGPATAGPTGV
jgi:AcrR family transcriptional regulator